MFRDEDAVWEHVAPRIRGPGWWWQRVEAVTPAGIPDVLGMNGPRTAWIELKEGPVRKSALRISQRQWFLDAGRVGAEAYILFGTSTGLRWFRDPRLLVEVAAPDFFRDSP
jgi:hypothetical protein